VDFGVDFGVAPRFRLHGSPQPSIAGNRASCGVVSISRICQEG